MDIPIDWDWLIDHVQETGWSEAAGEAGTWALTRLRSELGPRWPPAWRKAGSAPPEIVNSFAVLSALAGTIRLALAFTRLADCDGLATVSKELKRGSDEGRFASPRLQLVQAALARTAGYQVRLEPLLKGGKSRVDLEIRGGAEPMAVEAFALLRDRRTIDASVWLESAREGLRTMGEELGVDFVGQIVEPPDPAGIEAWLAELHVYARLSVQGVDLPPHQHGGVIIRIEPTSGRGGGSQFTMPAVSFRERLGMRLRKKAEQTVRSKGNWLLIDSFDVLWHMSGWSQLPLERKAEQLADLLQHELRGFGHILGVTITDGAALMRPGVPEETIDAGTYTALSRRSDAWHIRESVIVPLRPEAKAGLEIWRTMLDAESGWVGHELRRQGLLMPSELAQI